MTLRPRSRDELLAMLDRLVDEIDEAVEDLMSTVETKEPPQDEEPDQR